MKDTREPMPLVIVKKSNSLIQSIGKTTLLSNKVFLTALLHIEDRHGVSKAEQAYYDNLKAQTNIDFTDGLIAEFHNSDLTKILGKKGGSFYESLNELMNPRSPKSLRNQWVVMIKNPESGLYGSADLITATLYDDKAGKLYIKFTSEEAIKKEIYNMANNYASLDYRLMMQLKSVYSFRIYEMMMSRIGFQDDVTKRKQDVYSFTYGLSELKYMLGILDPYINDDVYTALAVKKPNYDLVENMISTEKVMPSYAEVKRNVLDKAKKEIDQMTNFIFDFAPIRSGRGGKVVEVELKMTRKTSVPKDIPKKELSDEAKEEVIEQIYAIIQEKLKLKDYTYIAEAAGYDIEKVKNAYNLMQNSHNQIENVTGWMIKAIKDGYSEPVPKQTNKKTNSFNKFEQNEYDFEQLELEIVDN